MRGKNKKPAGRTSCAVPHSGSHLAQELLHDRRQRDRHGTQPAFSSGTRRTLHALRGQEAGRGGVTAADVIAHAARRGVPRQSRLVVR